MPNKLRRLDLTEAHCKKPVPTGFPFQDLAVLRVDVTHLGVCPSNPSLRGEGTAGRCEAAGCARRRVRSVMFAHAGEVHDVPNKARQVCERRRESEAAVSCERAVSREPAGSRKNRRRIRWNTLRIFSGRERRRCLQIVCRSRMALLGQTPRLQGMARRGEHAEPKTRGRLRHPIEPSNRREDILKLVVA